MRPDRLLAFALAAALAACAGAPSRSGGAPSKEQDAAALQVKLGQEYMAKGELETAQEKLRRAIELDPRSVDAHTLLAVLNERIRRPEIAERYYRKAVELKPEDGNVTNNLGAFLCAQGRYDEAQRQFELAINDPFYKTPAVAFANSGVCARQAGDSARAEAQFRRALELDRTNLTALYEMAGIAHGKGEHLRARAFLQRYEARAPADAALLLLGVRVETALGDSKAAQGYRQRLAEQYPDFDLPPDLATPQS
jgi:type IV pilus assembly protein PilF